MYQPTFASVEFEQKKRKTRRERFLERLDALVPWEELEARIEPRYPKAGGGRRPYPLAVMLRIHVVQLCYNLSDPADPRREHDPALPPPAGAPRCTHRSETDPKRARKVIHFGACPSIVSGGAADVGGGDAPGGRRTRRAGQGAGRWPEPSAGRARDGDQPQHRPALHGAPGAGAGRAQAAPQAGPRARAAAGVAAHVDAVAVGPLPERQPVRLLASVADSRRRPEPAPFEGDRVGDALGNLAEQREQQVVMPDRYQRVAKTPTASRRLVVPTTTSSDGMRAGLLLTADTRLCQEHGLAWDTIPRGPRVALRKPGEVGD